MTMRRTFKIRFYCRKCRTRKDGTAPVEISVIVDGTREIFSLPRDCRPSDFPTKDLELYCDGVRSKINSIYTALSLAEEPISAFIIKDIYLNGARKVSYSLKNLFDDGLALKRSQATGAPAYSKYECIVRYFYEILKFPPAREAGSVTHADILMMKAELDKRHKPQTVEKEMIRLKYFFLLAFNSGKIRANPFAKIRIRRPEPDNVFLTQEEVARIRDLKILNDTEDRVRDAFLFMCYSGLEYADVAALEPQDFQEKDGLVYIKKKRVKTGVEYITVLYEDALEIREFYDGKIPLLSNQKMNKWLKKIGEEAGIEHNLTLLTARHTFGTYLIQKGLSMDVASKMLGHTNTRQTKTYAALLDETVLAANKDVSVSEGIPVPPDTTGAARAKNRGQSGHFDDEWEKELAEFERIFT